MKKLAKFKGLLLCLFIAFIAYGCQDFEGNLVVVKSFEVLDDKKNELVAIPVGDHAGKISVVARDKIKIKSDTISKRGVVLDIGRANLEKFKNPSFELLGEEINQEFDIVGTNQTTYSDSTIYAGSEQCLYYDTVQQCRVECSGVPPAQVCRRVCRWVQVQRYGRQNVQYFYRTKLQVLSLEFLAGDEELGSFGGESIERNKVYTYQSPCFRY